eukprot:g1066.t1
MRNSGYTLFFTHGRCPTYSANGRHSSSSAAAQSARLHRGAAVLAQRAARDIRHAAAAQTADVDRLAASSSPSAALKSLDKIRTAQEAAAAALWQLEYELQDELSPRQQMERLRAVRRDSDTALRALAELQRHWDTSSGGMRGHRHAPAADVALAATVHMRLMSVDQRLRGLEAVLRRTDAGNRQIAAALQVLEDRAEQRLGTLAAAAHPPIQHIAELVEVAQAEQRTATRLERVEEQVYHLRYRGGRGGDGGGSVGDVARQAGGGSAAGGVASAVRSGLGVMILVAAVITLLRNASTVMGMAGKGGGTGANARFPLQGQDEQQLQSSSSPGAAQDGHVHSCGGSGKEGGGTAAEDTALTAQAGGSGGSGGNDGTLGGLPPSARTFAA